jgi:hypothetical protein
MKLRKSRNESYKGCYAIEVSARCLEDGTFNTHGFIRHTVSNPNLINDLPHVDPFDIEGANYSTADAALDAGMGFRKKEDRRSKVEKPRANRGKKFSFREVHFPPVVFAKCRWSVTPKTFPYSSVG